jgi:ADP-ribose pyrophosphatase YjhB (NUDIX family)
MRSLKACLLLLVCLEGAPLLAQGAPECRVAPGSESTRQGNAGCIIKIDNKMLIVRHRKTGKLSPPAGTAKKGETAQCTAHRETWEETGVEVRVGRLLMSSDDQFHLFHCLAVDEVTELLVPEAFKSEISEILLLNPTLLSNDEWRFPEQLPSIKGAFEDVLSQ